MRQKVYGFKDFISNEYKSRVDEGIKDTFKKIGEWAKKIAQNIKDGIVKLIPSGSKKGLPMVTYFDPENGNIEEQINDFYKGSEFAKQNDSSVYEGETYYESTESTEILEARIPLEYTEEDQTVRDISTIELKTMIEKLYRSKVRGGRAKPIFIYGAPGIGKTQIVGAAAQSLGIGMINLDLQFMEPADFLGIPKVIEVEQPEYDENGRLINAGKGLTRSNPPVVLPVDNGKDDKGGIIFMDEMNRSNRMVLNSVMQFVQMGRIGEYNLPDKWVIVAAGNRPAEAEGVAEFDFALADRFNIVNLVPKVKDWTNWAKNSGKFETEFVEFVENNEELFHYLDTEKATLKYPTPRSWTDAAMALQDEIIDSGVESWRDLTSDTIYNIYHDSIGPTAAGKLKAYLDVLRKFKESDLEDVIKDPENAKMLDKKDFSNVVYGILEMVIKKAIKLSKTGKPSIQDLYNITLYFDRYKETEALAWVRKGILDRYPEFNITEDVLNSKDKKESQLIIAAANIMRKSAKDKNLV